MAKRLWSKLMGATRSKFLVAAWLSVNVACRSPTFSCRVVSAAADCGRTSRVLIMLSSRASRPMRGNLRCRVQPFLGGMGRSPLKFVGRPPALVLGCHNDRPRALPPDELIGAI